MSLKGLWELFSVQNGVITLGAPAATRSMEGRNEQDARMAMLERKVDIQEKAITELLDSNVKALRALSIISRGFDLRSQKELAAELAEMEKIEEFVLHHALAKQR